jgi:hypothetical protein
MMGGIREETMAAHDGDAPHGSRDRGTGFQIVTRVRRAAFILIALVLGAGAAVAKEPTLAERAAVIDAASREVDGERVVLGHISRHLGLPVDALRAERAQSGLGWGDVLIANRISGRSGVPYDQVVVEFRAGKAWEEIAREHGVDVDKLSADVARSEDEIEERSEDRTFQATPTRSPEKPAGSGGRSAGGAGRRQR